MVARTASQLKSDEIEVGAWVVYEVEVSTNDTITLSDFISSQALDQALLIKKSDRTSITRTIANNVITVTQVGITNVDCLLFVAGVED